MNPYREETDEKLLWLLRWYGDLRRTVRDFRPYVNVYELMNREYLRRNKIRNY